MAAGTGKGRWRYTVRNDARIWATGYCKGCSGHATAPEALEHQRQWELDHIDWKLAVATKWEPWAPCVVCATRSPYCIGFGPGEPSHVPVCLKHMRREHLEPYFQLSSLVISS